MESDREREIGNKMYLFDPKLLMKKIKMTAVFI